MKKTIFIMICLIFGVSINAQENNLQIHTVEIGFGGFYFKQKNYEGGGATFVANLTTSIKNNLISTTFLTGAEIGIVGSSTNNFNEFQLQYGREIKIKKWIKLESFLGIGYYNQKSKNSIILKGNTISIPVKLNTKFYFNNNFGIGINANYSINSINNNFSPNFIFHYKFK